ncbi:aspartate aminotransferase family protein [Myceligenerans pegani]|uniref:Aminotransferase class III-fold pyridoxal phosphate-dependent enzyme n=1 Tax=Myceligenerans pegani TaxID=2776917 RepID=A0ABR9MVG6_9MICO|nr:aminotransferase class III-fold pyridoxal phosphate-dependent enzyme [Myceligenerans sp. TRM 65318]MBE1875384.1 aminotransferase class III-fold pyridoxal phosphate-dependent enzyme [Myceligenerans sp. TRM 65318]MBE3017655.1 aminotransferase class III-fold pyridoxal phosphate-dependent enzyme [Myceligenerans sp. TRM 65318]
MTEVTLEELAEPYLRGVLATAGLDVEYVRGEGDRLYYRRGDEEVPVLDFVGGYGSTMLGHSNPELVAYAQELLAGHTPIHAQFSRHPYANEVAARLNRIIQRETGSDEPYFAIFANSGAEAIEAAMKHAELERYTRIEGLRAEIGANLEAAKAAAAAGTVTTRGVDAVVADVVAHNEALIAQTPLFLAPVGSFHGKLAGSTQLTYNPVYRAVFSALAAQARFVPVDEPGAVDDIVRSESRELHDVVVEGDRIEVVRRPFPRFCAVVLEPILGEGGIHELPETFVRDVRRVATELDIPVVVDEIQSGMGRTGAFLASSHLGLRGDYYAMAKSLGGGIAKAAVMLVRASRYQTSFEMMHSSTFAKDSFSCLIAGKVLEMLEADDGGVYRAAQSRGTELRSALRGLQEEFPEVLKDVRGRGLMVGLEFFEQGDATSETLRELHGSGFFGYFLSGYLLREHGIRTFPTSSAVYTLRFEPSAYIGAPDIARLTEALRELCRQIRDTDGRRLAPIG